MPRRRMSADARRMVLGIGVDAATIFELCEVDGYDLRWDELLHHESGAPYLAMDGRMAGVFEAASVRSALVSITNEGDLATAMVLVQD